MGFKQQDHRRTIFGTPKEIFSEGEPFLPTLSLLKIKALCWHCGSITFTINGEEKHNCIINDSSQ